MNTSTVLKTLAFTSAAGIILAGCSKQTTTLDRQSPANSAADSNAMTNDVSPAPVATTVPDTAQPTLSSSTKTDDLKKDLDNTTVKSEDFSDL